MRHRSLAADLYQSSRSLSSSPGAEYFRIAFETPVPFPPSGYLFIHFTLEHPYYILAYDWKKLPALWMDEQHPGQVFWIFRLTWKEPRKKLVSGCSGAGRGNWLTGCGYVQILTARVQTDIPIVILSLSDIGSRCKRSYSRTLSCNSKSDAA